MAFDDWATSPYVPANTNTPGNRLDHRRGRFSVDYETNQINAALRGFQNVYGDSVEYYRFDAATSVTDDIYDEGSGVGRSYIGPAEVPCLHVQLFEGGREETAGGLYYNDTLHVTASFDALVKIGLTRGDLEHQHYLLDRMVYNGKVFKTKTISILGQVQRRDIIVSIDAEQVRSDELVGDAQFARYSA